MTSADMFDHDSACKYIEDAASLGSRLGLGRIEKLCELLGNPEDKLRFIHIAGTNGKGSVAAMISSVLRCAGVRVGMYYSPALCGLTDHYRINGELITEDEYAMCVSEVAKANDRLIEELGESATQFELETAIAFVYFCKNHCDAVILECGMGGRDDATNIVKNKICCVFASISYDHMQYLGNTLTEIATVKAGIITSDCPVIAYGSSQEVIDVIQKRCDTTGSRLYVVDPEDITYTDTDTGICVSCEDCSDIQVALAGSYQAGNAATAIKALSVIGTDKLINGCKIDETVIRKGLADVKWPFRFECISDDPLIYVDGAHNEDAALKLAKTIGDRLSGRKIILVLGMFRDKEYEKVIGILGRTAHMIFALTVPDAKRALFAEDVADCARKCCGLVTVCDSIKDAYESAVSAAKAAGPDSAVVAAGSLSYLNEFARCGKDIGKSK